MMFDMLHFFMLFYKNFTKTIFGTLQSELRIKHVNKITTDEVQKNKLTFGLEN